MDIDGRCERLQFCYGFHVHLASKQPNSSYASHQVTVTLVLTTVSVPAILSLHRMDQPR